MVSKNKKVIAEKRIGNYQVTQLQDTYEVKIIEDDNVSPRRIFNKSDVLDAGFFDESEKIFTDKLAEKRPPSRKQLRDLKRQLKMFKKKK